MLGHGALGEKPLGVGPTGTSTAVSGTLAATEAADVFAGAGVLGVTGTLAASEAADTFAGAGVLGVSGILAASEAADTFTGTGVLGVSGTLAASEAADVFSGSGTVAIPVTGTLAATETPDAFSGTGSIVIKAQVQAGGGVASAGLTAKELRKLHEKNRELRSRANRLSTPVVISLRAELPQPKVTAQVSFLIPEIRVVEMRPIKVTFTTPRLTGAGRVMTTIRMRPLVAVFTMPQVKADARVPPMMPAITVQPTAGEFTQPTFKGKGRVVEMKDEVRIHRSELEDMAAEIKHLRRMMAILAA